MVESVRIRTRFGMLLTTFDAGEVQRIRFGEYAPSDGATVVDDPISGSARGCVDRLVAYFDGDRDSLRDAARVPAGTDFQERVWRATTAIPYGETTSYGAIAERVGEPGAAQAVGLALNANPLPVIVPCHRVVSSNGDLTGFGGGLGWKRALLSLEAPQFDLGFRTCQPVS